MMDYQDTPEFWEWFVRQRLVVIARHVEDVLRRLQGVHGGTIGGAPSRAGDIVTRADEEASKMVRTCVATTCNSVRVALLDGKRGVLEPIHEHPQVGLIVDELDGTRPFRMGIPTGAISIAAYPLDEEPLLRNVRGGLLLRLDTGHIYAFVRGQGVWRSNILLGRIEDDTPLDRACLYVDEGSTDSVLHELYLRPFNVNVRLGRVLMCSCCYGATLLLDGDAHVLLHLAYRELGRWPPARRHIRAAWGEFECSPYSYDVAAVVPMLQERGCMVTDAFGRPLDDLIIDKSGSDFVVPGLIATTSVGLHHATLETINKREQALQERRAEIDAAMQL